MLDNIDNLVVFSKKMEMEVNGDNTLSYSVDFFHEEFFTYDFLVYITNRIPEAYIRLFDGLNLVDTIFPKDVKSNIRNFVEECHSKKLDVDFMYQLNGKTFSILKQYSKNEITVVTSNNEKGVDNLNILIDKLKNDYVLYTESEMLYNYLTGMNNETILECSYDIVNRLLSFQNDVEYQKFYDDNLKWLKEKFSFISNDRTYWEIKLNEIKSKLV